MPEEMPEEQESLEEIAEEMIEQLNCTPVLECGDWEECRVDYNLEDLIEEEYIDLEGTQKRDCTDTTGCINYIVEEEKECKIEVPIEIKEIFNCEEKIIEVYETETQKLVSRVTESNNLSEVNVNFLATTDEGFCNYCFDGIQDYDETEIDCGGPNCPDCSQEFSDSFVIVKSFILATGSMATFFILFNLLRSLATSAAETAVTSAAV